MLCMCEPADLGRAVCADRGGAWAEVLGRGSASAEAELMASGVPVIYLYDKAPGGIGLVEQVAASGETFFAQILSFLQSCSCERGCPSCLGPDHAALASSDPQGEPSLRAGLVDCVQELLKIFGDDPRGVSEADSALQLPKVEATCC